MSDFLTHLIDRAAGRGSLLERRPRSLFEPAGAGGAAALEEQHDEVTANLPRAATLQRDAVEMAAAPGVNPPAPAATIAARPPADAIQSPAVPRKPKGAMSAIVERAEPPPPLQVPVRETVLHTERTTTVLEARAAANPAAMADTAAPKSRRSAKSAMEAAMEPPPARARQGEGDGDPPRAPALRAAQRRDPPQLAPAERPQRQAAAAVLIAKAQAGPKAPLPAAAAAPAPVQISIGRVEVRAHSATEPRPRPAAAAAPKLKLDDYLRQRSGGTS